MLIKRSLILAKIEVTYGTDSTPTPAANSIRVSDPQVNVNSDKLERPVARPSLSPIAHLIGKKFVELTFSTELKGSGDAGDIVIEVDPLFRACGMAVANTPGASDVYLPASSGLESVTIWTYLDGILHKITGCRGSFELTGEAGAQPKINWTFQGLYATPTDAAIPAGAAFDSTKGPVFQAATFTWGAYAAIIQQLQINLNNELSVDESVNATHGIAGVEIIGRAPGGSINPKAVTEATRTFWANWEAGSGATLSCRIGSVAGNKVLIESAADSAVKESISWGERNGFRIYEIPFGLYSEAGDTELKLTFD